MSRTLTSGVATAVAGAHVTRCHLVELDFDSGIVRVNDTSFDLTWGGNTYYGMGRIGKIEDLKETLASVATGTKYTLAGPITSYLSLALNEQAQGRPAYFYVAFFNASHQVIADPVLERKELIDVLATNEANGLAEIIVTTESRFIAWARPVVSRHNDADQQSKYPGDTFYKFAPTMVSRTIIWPARNFFAK